MATDTDRALDTHVVFFDVDQDGEITLPEIRQALKELGFSRLVTAIVAPVRSLALPEDFLNGELFRRIIDSREPG